MRVSAGGCDLTPHVPPCFTGLVREGCGARADGATRGIRRAVCLAHVRTRSPQGSVDVEEPVYLADCPERMYRHRLCAGAAEGGRTCATLRSALPAVQDRYQG